MNNLSAVANHIAISSVHLNRPKSKLVEATADISLQKKYENSLACHSALINAISEAVVSLDISFIVQSWNRAAEKIFQVSEKDAIGKSLHDVMNFTVLKGSFEEANQKIINTGNWTGESILFCPDGTELYLRTSVNALRDEQNELFGYVATSRDITDYKEITDNLQKERFLNLKLKKAKQRLLAMQGQFNAFMEHSPAISWIVDDEGIFHYFNPLFLKLFNLAPTDSGKHVREIFPAEVAEEYLRNNAVVFETGKPFEVTEAGFKPNGKKATYKVLKFPLHLGGKRKYQGGIAIDITEELEHQEQLALSNERFRLVNKATSDSIWDWNVIEDVLLKGENFDSFDKNELPYRIAESLDKICEKDKDRVHKSLYKAIENSNVSFWSEEYQVACPNGTCQTVNDKAFIIRDDKGKAVRVIGALQDITEKKELLHKIVEQEKSKQKEMVMAAMNAQEKERHEIAYELHDNVNQLLTTCKLQLESAECFQNDPTYLARISGYIQKIIDEIRSITHQLNPSNLENIGLAASIEDLVRKINATGRLQINFSTEEIDKNCRFSKEIELAVFRIVQEQIQNIIKHSGAKQATITLHKTLEELALLIEDNGVGFNQEKARSGLGLTNIINRAEYYGGSAKIRSGKGKGCSVNVRLPFKSLS